MHLSSSLFFFVKIFFHKVKMKIFISLLSILTIFFHPTTSTGVDLAASWIWTVSMLKVNIVCHL
jgi:hypothetical protein